MFSILQNSLQILGFDFLKVRDIFVLVVGGGLIISSLNWGASFLLVGGVLRIVGFLFSSSRVLIFGHLRGLG